MEGRAALKLGNAFEKKYNVPILSSRFGEQWLLAGV